MAFIVGGTCAHAVRCMNGLRRLYGMQPYDRMGTECPPYNYLPIQKRLKITPSKSSGVNSPVMLDS